MERMGLVSQIEARLERMISLDRLPADGSLPSEQTLARRYDVSRATLREALLRLSARGLVVQRPGRKTRAVALDEAVTLETLGVALHGEGGSHPERRRLLEGYLELKRETVVDLLASCCERASTLELEKLTEACFALRDAARWEEERSGWVKREFELLRLAARVADRPGHFLLIQSLERSFWGMTARVLPNLDSGAIQSWSQCALHALGERDAQALRSELLPLLQASDDHVLGRPTPASEAEDPPKTRRTETMPLQEEETAAYRAEVEPGLEEPAEAHRTEAEPLEHERTEAQHSAAQSLHARGSAPEPTGRDVPVPTCPSLSGCQTGFCHVLPTEERLPEASSTGSSPPPGHAAECALPSPFRGARAGQVVAPPQLEPAPAVQPKQ
jgi:DNA-binding FadR family transcriptional regulator